LYLKSSWQTCTWHEKHACIITLVIALWNEGRTCCCVFTLFLKRWIFVISWVTNFQYSRRTTCWQLSVCLNKPKNCLKSKSISNLKTFIGYQYCDFRLWNFLCYSGKRFPGNLAMYRADNWSPDDDTWNKFGRMSTTFTTLFQLKPREDDGNVCGKRIWTYVQRACFLRLKHASPAFLVIHAVYCVLKRARLEWKIFASVLTFFTNYATNSRTPCIESINELRISSRSPATTHADLFSQVIPGHSLEV